MSSEIKLALNSATIALARILFSLFRTYFVVIEELLRLAVPGYKRSLVFKQIMDLGDSGNAVDVDARIKKIDAARDNLQDAIQAIDELRDQADLNKKELRDALSRIDEVEKQKSELNNELQTLQKIAEADTNAFRRIVGLPTKGDVWRERLLGFGSGVVASVVASIIFVFIQKLV